MGGECGCEVSIKKEEQMELPVKWLWRKWHGFLDSKNMKTGPNAMSHLEPNRTNPITMEMRGGGKNGIIYLYILSHSF